VYVPPASGVEQASHVTIRTRGGSLVTTDDADENPLASRFLWAFCCTKLTAAELDSYARSTAATPAEVTPRTDVSSDDQPGAAACS